jgi:PAS domain S-box-containing protein
MNFLSVPGKNYLSSLRGMVLVSHLFSLTLFSGFFVYVWLSGKQNHEESQFIMIAPAVYFTVILLTVVSGYFLLTRINKSYKIVHNQIQKIAEGNIPSREAETGDEFGELIVLNNQVINNLENIKLFSGEVGRGNFEFRSSVFNSNTDIGESLQEMKNSLKKVAEADRKRNWAALGLAQMGEILRNYTNSPDIFYQTILSFIVKYINANQAGLFISETGENNAVFLDLAACYAYDRKKYVSRRIEPGDGLVGQAFLEGEFIYLTDVPDNYLFITSGLGSANPRNVLLVPLKVNDEINGVLELASFNIFEDFQIEFINKIAENIAVAVSTLKVSQKTSHLLGQSQLMTEELRAQEEELRQNLEEMKSIQDEMQRVQDEMRTQNQIINSVAIVSKTDVRGNITYVNDEFVKWSGYKPEEIIGKNHRILKSGHQDDKIFEELWKTISSGKIFRGEIKNRAKDGSYYWVDAIIAPVLGTEGKPVEYIAQRFVINDKKEREAYTEELLLNLKKQEAELNDRISEALKAKNELAAVAEEMMTDLKIINSAFAAIELNMEGKIVKANDKFLALLGYTSEEIMGCHHEILVTPEERRSLNYKNCWIRLGEGQAVDGEFERLTRSGKKIKLRSIYNPVFDEQNKPVKVLKLSYAVSGVASV